MNSYSLNGGMHVTHDHYGPRHANVSQSIVADIDEVPFFVALLIRRNGFLIVSANSLSVRKTIHKLARQQFNHHRAKYYCSESIQKRSKQASAVKLMDSPDKSRLNQFQLR